MGARMPIGRALTNLAKDVIEPDPALAQKLKRPVEKYYPDNTVEVEVVLPDEALFLVDIDTQRSRSIPWDEVRRSRRIAGSVALRHYGEGSVYSEDENEHPLRLVRCWFGDEEDAEESSEKGCLLFSEELIVHAAIARNAEN